MGDVRAGPDPEVAAVVGHLVCEEEPARRVNVPGSSGGGRVSTDVGSARGVDGGTREY